MSVTDPFLYLEDDDDPRTVAWIAEHTGRGRTVLDAMPGRSAFSDLVWQLVDLPRRLIPTVRGETLFFEKRRPGEGFGSLRLQANGGPSRLLVDPAAFGVRGRTYLSIWSVSPDGRHVAYQVCADGAEIGDLRVLRVSDGMPLDAFVPGWRRSALAWLGEGELVYGRHTDEVDSRGLHTLNLSSGKSSFVWCPEMPPGPLFMAPSVSGRGAVAVSVRQGADSRNALWLWADMTGRDQRPPRQLLAAGKAVAQPRFGPDDRLFVATTLDAPHGRICLVDPARPEPENWQTIVPQLPGCALQAFAATVDSVVTAVSSRGQIRLDRTALDGSAVRVPIDLPATAVVTALTSDPTGADEVWLDYCDATTPLGVQRLAPDADGLWRTDPWGIPDVGEAFAPMVTHRELDTEDGQTIGMTILSGPGPVRAAPTMLQVYGGFGAVAKAAFRADTHSWVAAGGVHVYARIRGDGDYGAEGAAAGRRAGKIGTVEDVLRIARYLISEGWTTPAQLALFGGSNGGMVALAALLREPALFGACVVSAPVTDLLRFPLLGDGAAWLNEYGDPDQPADREFLTALSPYHNVADGVRYPPTLIMAGGGDTRVPAAHARKMTARLAAAGWEDPGHLVFREERNLGHGHRSVASIADVIIDRHAFLAHHLRLATPSG